MASWSKTCDRRVSYPHFLQRSGACQIRRQVSFVRSIEGLDIVISVSHASPGISRRPCSSARVAAARRGFAETCFPLTNPVSIYNEIRVPDELHQEPLRVRARREPGETVLVHGCIWSSQHSTPPGSSRSRSEKRPVVSSEAKAAVARENRTTHLVAPTSEKTVVEHRRRQRLSTSCSTQHCSLYGAVSH